MDLKIYTIQDLESLGRETPLARLNVLDEKDGREYSVNTSGSRMGMGIGEYFEVTAEPVGKPFSIAIPSLDSLTTNVQRMTDHLGLAIKRNIIDLYPYKELKHYAYDANLGSQLFDFSLHAVQVYKFKRLREK